jgi:uncharacterized membrane protein YdjX (TVP38/TMEM64 family)
MDWWKELLKLDLEDIKHILNQYEALGPLPGIFVPMIESFLPFLPLVVIIIANAEAYDLFYGFLLSWIGVVIGSTSVFMLVRLFGQRFRGFLERKVAKSAKFIHWIERKGFTPIFILACFPFTPSAVINIVAGLSNLPLHTFFVATVLGKGVMIFLVSYVGYDLMDLVKSPWKLILVVLVFSAMWWFGRKVESRYMN